MTKITPPFYPIIYVRGYAMTEGEIDATTNTPYMGFNLGSTKIRQKADGKIARYFFESPLVRLMKDYGYQDIYDGGTIKAGPIQSRSIIIHRYYDAGKAPSIEEAAADLGGLIKKIHNQFLDSKGKPDKNFKVYLVAHSMGGLICRCFLQNDKISEPVTKRLVDKVFTYATPHNGIEMAGINVPRFLSLFDINNFNRQAMAKYLGLNSDKRVDTLNGKFDQNKFFCLIGTNYEDYTAAMGLSRSLAGEMSDGLVKIMNAAIQGSPRAFTHRSHSGYFGIVNSESGYQNLIRFLFGNIKVVGTLEVDQTPLPPSVKKALSGGKDVKASYLFEATVAPRGSQTYKLTERRKDTFSAVFREYDELKPKDRDGGVRRSPVLFSIFLDKNKITTSRGRSVVFTIDLSVSTTGYEIERTLLPDKIIPGEYLFRNTIMVKAAPQKEGWNIYYAFTDDRWGETRGQKANSGQLNFSIPIKSRKGFAGKLILDITAWN